MAAKEVADPDKINTPPEGSQPPAPEVTEAEKVASKVITFVRNLAPNAALKIGEAVYQFKHGTFSTDDPKIIEDIKKVMHDFHIVLQ